ncbi:MAG: hypothetical protein ACFB51_02185 [Anaerolineae bacterium]
MWDKLPDQNNDDIEERLRSVMQNLDVDDADLPGEDDDAPLIALVYRHADSIVVTDRLYNTLAERFGDDAIVRESGLGTEDIPLAEDLVEDDVMLVVIGKKWLAMKDGDTRLIDDPADPVRQAIETALGLGLPIYPVLVYGAALPRAEFLPEPIRALAE